MPLKKISLRCAGVVILCVFIIALIGWHSIDARPPAWDETIHLQLALDYRDFLLHGTHIETRWTTIYPPLYHLSLIPMLSLGQPSVLKAVLVNVAYLALLLWALSAFARGCGVSPWLGLLASVIVIATPVMLWTERRPLIDFALTAWVAAGMEWLRRTEHFSKRRAVVVWGIWSGLGMLLKPFYALWFVGPVLLCLWQGRQVHNGTAPRIIPWRNLFLGLAIIFITALPYYGWQGVLFFNNAVQLSGAQGASEGDPGFQSLAGWWYYPRALYQQLGLVIGLPLCIGLLWTLARRRLQPSALRNGTTWLVAWITSGYVLFTFNHNKDLRYTLPLLPPLVLLALWSCAPWLQQQRAKIIALGAVLALFICNAWRIDRPSAQDWQQEKVSELLLSNTQAQPPFLLAGVISNHPYFFSRNLVWSMRRQGYQLSTLSLDGPLANFNEFILFKTLDVYSPLDAQQRTDLQNSGRAFHQYYPLLSRVPLPDGSYAEIHRRDPHPVFDVGDIDQQDFERRLQVSLGNLIEGPLSVHITGNADDWRHGFVPLMTIAGGPWRVRGVPVSNGQIELHNAHFNLYKLWDQHTLGLVALDSMSPNLTLRSDELTAYLQSKAHHFDALTISLNANTLHVSAEYAHIPVAADIVLELQAQPRALLATLKKIRIAGLAIPGWLLGKVSHQALMLDASPAFPSRVDIKAMHGDDGTLRITS